MWLLAGYTEGPMEGRRYFADSFMPLTNSWESKELLPHPFAGSMETNADGSVIIDGVIYMTSGNQGAINTYDIASHTFVESAISMESEFSEIMFIALCKSHANDYLTLNFQKKDVLN